MRYDLGKWRGIPVGIHATLVLFSLYFALKTGDVAALVVMLAALLFQVFLHEVAHMAAGVWRGGTPAGIYLQPFGELSALRFRPAGALDDILVTLAGPLASFAGGAVFVWLGNLLAITGGAGEALKGAGWLTLQWAAFNLLPAYPMDGGRILYRILSFYSMPFSAAMAALRTSQVVVIVIGLYGLLAGSLFWLVLAGYLFWRILLTSPDVLQSARNSTPAATVSPPPYARRPARRVEVYRED